MSSPNEANRCGVSAFTSMRPGEFHQTPRLAIYVASTARFGEISRWMPKLQLHLSRRTAGVAVIPYGRRLSSHVSRLRVLCGIEVRKCMGSERDAVLQRHDGRAVA